MCQALTQALGTKQWTKQLLVSSKLLSSMVDNDKQILCQVVINVVKKNKGDRRIESGRRDAIFYKMPYYIAITSLFNPSSINEQSDHF